MSDNRPEIVLDGDVSPLRQKLREAAADLKKFGSDGETAIGRMSGPLGALQSKFMAVGAVLAGGAVFKEAVRQAAEFTEQSMKLGVALGTSATEASTFITALEDIDVTQEDFIAATKAMSKELLNNEESLTSMGLKTRDAAGHLRPLNQLTVEGIEIVNGYKAGTDRAIAGQTMFGKSFQLTGNLLKLNSETLAENAALQQKLGAIVGGENVAAWEAYDSAGDKANLTLKAVNTTVGNALIPVLTQLSEWFVSIGPSAVVVFKGVIGSLASIFWGLKMSAEIVWNVLALGIEKATIQCLRFGDVAVKALQFDFKGAKAAWDLGGEMIEEVTKKRLNNIVSAAEDTQKKLWNLFAEGTPSAAASTEGKSATGLLKPPTVKEAKEKKDVDPSFMGTYDAQLASIKNLYEQENTLREFSKTQELAYWREIQDNLTLTGKDATAIAKRTASLELEIRREAARETRALDSVMLDSKRSAALAQIELEQQQANFARDNGEITKLQLLTQEEQFARRRFEIEYQSLLERQELAKNDPATSPAALAQNKEQMLAIERQYLIQKGALDQNKKKEGGSFGGLFDDVGTGFASAAQKMFTTATTLRAQLANIFQSIYQSFIVNMVTKPVGEWIASNARLLAVKMGFLAADTGATVAASSTNAAVKTTEAGVIVGANALEAGSGAASAVASIPYVGPVLALAAMASVFGAVMSLGSKKSASMGFDIPKGLNPLTQLHEEEMVLPKIHANTIRRLGEMVDSSGQGGGTVNNNYHIQAWDGADVRRVLLKNAHHVSDALGNSIRNGRSVKGR